MDSQLFDLETVQEGVFTWPQGWLSQRREQLRQAQEERDEANKR